MVLEAHTPTGAVTVGEYVEDKIGSSDDKKYMCIVLCSGLTLFMLCTCLIHLAFVWWHQDEHLDQDVTLGNVYQDVSKPFGQVFIIFAGQTILYSCYLAGTIERSIKAYFSKLVLLYLLISFYMMLLLKAQMGGVFTDSLPTWRVLLRAPTHELNRLRLRASAKATEPADDTATLSIHIDCAQEEYDKSKKKREEKSKEVKEEERPNPGRFEMVLRCLMDFQVNACYFHTMMATFPLFLSCSDSLLDLVKDVFAVAFIAGLDDAFGSNIVFNVKLDAASRTTSDL
jgi:hypothetical protein